MLRELTREEKRARIHALDEITLMRWSYVPFVIAEGCWDYADTIITLSAQMRIPETKKLCRQIRELRSSFNSRRKAHAIGSSGHEMENFEVVEDASGKSFAYMNKCIKDSAVAQYPELDENNLMLLTSVYACITMLDVLFKYMDEQEAKICKLCRFESVGSLLPPEMRILRRLIPLFAGDKPVRVKGLGIFIHNVVSALSNVAFDKQNDTDADTPITDTDTPAADTDTPAAV